MKAPTMQARYKCPTCKKEFRAMHFSDYRKATGNTIKHCGTPSIWLKNVEAK